jgi:chromosomal replication initiation ATPase DnaA
VQLEFDARSNGCTIDEQQVVAFLARQPQASSTSVQDIGLAVARHFHLPIDDLRSASRKRTLVMARGVTVYLSRKHTRASFMALGQWLGGRDHTTVMHAYQSTVKAIAADETVATAVRHLEAWLDTVKTIGPENSDAGESDTVKYNTGESMSARCRPAVGSSP